MDQDGHSLPNYRFQPPIAAPPRRRPSSDPAILIIFLVILSLLFLFFFLHLPASIPKIIIPPFPQTIIKPPFPQTIIKPTPVKSNWNFLIIFLFLFSILSSVLAQRNDARAPENYPYQDNGDPRRSSSYPDFRQENGDNRLRSFDNLGVDKQFSSTVNSHSRWKEGGNENMNRPEPVSGDIRRRGPRVEESIEADRNVPESMILESDDFHSSSSQSSSSGTQNSPPRPPFKLPPRKFDVMLRSVHSSDFSSPDRDGPPSNIDGGDSVGPSPRSFRSPDVNAKADSFISRRKNEWTTEKKKSRLRKRSPSPK